tara:strand:- start:12765 stop:13454 length:690 start_codon:yes stop_codon:yes gene_type:complete
MKNLVLILFLICNAAFSQTVQGIGSSSGVITPAQAGISYREVEIEGSPYIDEIFKKGQTIINDKNVSDVLMRYDAYHDVIEIMNENNKVRTLLRRNNIVAVIDNTTYMVREYEFVGSVKEGYFNPLNEGYTRLLVKPKKKFVQAKNPENGYDTFSPAQYLDISMYYMQNGDKPAKEIKLSKKRVLGFLSNHSKILNKYIKENALNMRSKNDIIRLIEYYNTLNKDEVML